MTAEIVALLTSVGIAFVGAGFSISVMADRKKETVEEQLNSLYFDVQSRQLEPMLTQLIFQRKAKQNPLAYMASPEVVEDLRSFKTYLSQYMKADEYREVICFSLSCAGTSLIIAGLIVVSLMIIGFFVSAPNMNFLGSLILVAGGLMFFYFQRKYATFSERYFTAIREIRRVI